MNGDYPSSSEFHPGHGIEFPFKRDDKPGKKIGDFHMTHAEIAAELAKDGSTLLSRERIRQIEAGALHKLAVALRKQGIGFEDLI